MRVDSPTILSRIVRSLSDRNAPRSSADLAREFLGIAACDERTAAKLIDPWLEADPRLLRGADGWMVRESAEPLYTAAAPALLDATLVWAPQAIPSALVERAASDSRFCVALSGGVEVERAELRLGERLPRPAISLLDLVRRWRGYRGHADLLQIAEALRLPHIEEPEDAAEGAGLRLLGSIWRAMVAALSGEAIDDLLGLEALLNEKLERADFAGKQFTPDDLAALPAAPGVYIFKDARGRTLYVGRSCNLAARVGSYFSGVPRDQKDREIRSLAAALETRAVATTADAVLLEAATIRRLAPSLNTQRAIHRAKVVDGVLVATREDGRPGAVLFVIAGGGLRRRLVSPLDKRAREIAERAAALLFEAGWNPSPLDRRKGAQLESWRSAEGGRLLEPGVVGGEGEIARRVLDVIYSQN